MKFFKVQILKKIILIKSLKMEEMSIKTEVIINIYYYFFFSFLIELILLTPNPVLVQIYPIYYFNKLRNILSFCKFIK